MATEVKTLPHEQEQILQLAVEGLIKGYPSSELTFKLQQDVPPVEKDSIDKTIREAVGVIKETTLTDIDKIIPLHVEIYEAVYREFETMRFTPGKLKALKAKERLLGLLKETNYIEVHNELNLEIEKEPEYDLTKLSPIEQQRLESLIKRIERQ